MYVKVRVTASAGRELVKKRSENSFDISVREDAQGNRANGRVRALVADIYAVSLSAVRIVSGHHSGSKILSITYRD